MSKLFGLIKSWLAREEPSQRVDAPGICDCPCCGYRTLPDRDAYSICPVCFWEDDGDWDPDDELERSGPNHGLTLGEGRANFAAFGACEPRLRGSVRAPTPREKSLREGR
jgi:hypothetical protein